MIIYTSLAHNYYHYFSISFSLFLYIAFVIHQRGVDRMPQSKAIVSTIMDRSARKRWKKKDSTEIKNENIETFSKKYVFVDY